MPAGRPPTPIERKEKLGNPGSRSLEPKITLLPAPAASPPPPKHLRTDGIEAWDRVWTHGGTWVSPTTDLALVTRYAEAHDRRAALLQILDEEGLMSHGYKGQPRVHPALAELNTLDAMLLKHESVLGFTPSDRARLGLTQAKAVSKLDELLNRRNAPGS